MSGLPIKSLMILLCKKRGEGLGTGTEIIGIAQMHKSNAVPVRGKKQATEVATMRRN